MSKVDILMVFHPCHGASLDFLAMLMNELTLLCQTVLHYPFSSGKTEEKKENNEEETR